MTATTITIKGTLMTSDDDDEPQAQPMAPPAYEYLVVEIQSQDPAVITVELNKYAADGWELVTANGRPGGSMIYTLRKWGS